MIKGFDVSHNNNIRWDNVSADFKFVFIKASQGGTFHDPAFQNNWHAARDKGLLHGAYHFLTATDSAKIQSDNFLNRGVDWSLKGVLPPVLDVEDQVPASLNKNILNNKQAFIDLVSEWVEIVAVETGREPIIYSYKNFFSEYLNDHAWINNPLWLASYQANYPGLPKCYKELAFWQYTQYGKLDGTFTYDAKEAQRIGAEFDLDYFNGSMDELNKLANF